MPAQSRRYTQRHFQDITRLLAGEREQHGASPALDRMVTAFTDLFTADSKGAGSKLPYTFDPVLFRRAAMGRVPVTSRPQRNRGKTSPGTWAQALRSRETFTDGYLTGKPVDPHNRSKQYAQWASGSSARLMAGTSAGGTILAMPMGGGSPLPPLGKLDPGPAMAMALAEARYVVYSHGTVIAWWLGPEVAGSAHGREEGEWIEVSQVCNDEYGRFSPDIDEDQDRVHAALSAS